MAIVKSIENPRNRAVATYWRLARVRFDIDPVNYVMAGYADKAAARDKLDPVDEVTTEIDNAKDLPLSRADIYAHAKAGMFAGATDD